uniref:Uncharacterized protein n=1 Tax=Mola mola TaxID=94237 RepID=A0A3Q3W7K8_MOLML
MKGVHAVALCVFVFHCIPGSRRAQATRETSLGNTSSAASSCDLSLLTCMLIGSYRFCIIPLLAALNEKDRTGLFISSM